MINILFIIPYPKLKSVVISAIEDNLGKAELNVDIVVATVDKIPEIDTSKYDVIVARGYTARRTKSEYISLPTVELDISSYDIIRSLQECKEKFNPKRVAFCGFYGALYGAKEFGEIVGCRVEVYKPNNNRELYEAIKQAKSNGYEAIIGGYSALMHSKKVGINATVIKTGQEAILQSLNEAIRTAKILKEERIKAEMYRIITKSSKEGILYVNKTGTIGVDNKTAQDIMQTDPLCHKELKRELPFLESNFIKSLETGKEILNEIHKLTRKTTISVSHIPVVVGKEVNGVVINFTDITRVQELEGQIRKKLNEKGLQAK
jgi:transcriptional regulator with PAS, ATPase and Fis domain